MVCSAKKFADTKGVKTWKICVVNYDTARHLLPWAAAVLSAQGRLSSSSWYRYMHFPNYTLRLVSLLPYSYISFHCHLTPPPTFLCSFSFSVLAFLFSFIIFQSRLIRNRPTWNAFRAIFVNRISAIVYLLRST